MESRLRRFINHRREKLANSHKNEGDLLSTSSRSASLQDLTPTSILQSMTRSNADKTKTLPVVDLEFHSVPYEQTPAGTAPIFGTGPLKGNGPVKLQASRRLSSGELLANPQDDQPTFEGIMEGEYIIGGKSRRESSARSLRSPALQSVTASTGRRSSTVYSPRSPSVASKSSATFHQNVNPESTVRSSDTPSDRGLGISTTSTTWPATSRDQCENSPSTVTSISQFSCDPETPLSYLAPIDEQNATIAALWKAEYSRLVHIYGHDGVQRNIAKMNAANGRLSVLPSAPHSDKQRLSIVLDPLPRPTREKESCDLRRSSVTSGLSTICRDDDSDASSNKRVSQISSCAGSSAHTTNTTMTDHDTVVTRDDIRKIIDDMRTTYLRAFEAHAPSVPNPGHIRKKKRRTKIGSPGVDLRPRTGKSGHSRQTWHAHANNTSDVVSRQRKTRPISQAVTGFGRLSPVEDSPTRAEARPIQRLHRADSGTLGSIMANIESDRLLLKTNAAHDHVPTMSSLPNTNSEELSSLGDSFADGQKARHSGSSFHHLVTRPTGNFF